MIGGFFLFLLPVSYIILITKIKTEVASMRRAFKHKLILNKEQEELINKIIGNTKKSSRRNLCLSIV